MYRIIFIDDEAITLSLLESAIDWEKYQITIAGVASDGEEGLALFQQVHPDIVIADIRMPKLDGIAFSRLVRQQDAHVRILLLSAYADFEYAQSAISYQISEYLLKPLDEDKLEQTIARIVRELEQDDTLSHHLKTYRTRHAEQYFQQLLSQYSDGKSLPELPRMPEEAGAILAQADSLIDVLSTNVSTEPDDYTTIEAIAQHLRAQLGATPLVTVLSPIELVVLGNEAALQPALLDAICRLAQQGLPIRCGISSITTPSQFLKTYHEAQQALNQGFYNGETLCRYDSRMTFASHITINVADLEQQIILLVEQGEDGELTEVLHAHLQTLFVHHTEPTLIYDFLIEVFTWLKIAIARQYRDEAIGAPLAISRQQLRGCATQTALVDYTTALLQTISAAISQFLAQNSNYYVVRRAKEYTRQHYRQPTFALQDVADDVGLSKNHFSKVFHESTGQKFWDYVTEYRIRKAKELLRNSNQSNAEISLAIGYESEFYFSKIFKKVTGLTPQQFKKR